MVRGLPGIGPYAAEQLERPNIADDFNAMEAAITTAGATIIGMVRDASGNLETETISAQGDRSEIQFDTAATATLQAQLTALIATID